MRRGLGFHARRSPGGFNPLSLFAGGINGAWYDPSDATTLFSDRAGTTPCATPGAGAVVPVGLMLDKSQGLVLGSEAVTNGGPFTATTGWTAGSGGTLSVSSSNLRITNGIADGADAVFSASAPTAGKWYRVQFTIVSRTTSYPARIFFGGNSITGLSAGSYTYYLRATTTGAFTLSNGATGVIGEFADYNNISVRELPGNHAIAANDTTARPELSARVNLLTYSEQFENGVWDKLNGVTISQNSAIAPDGTTTADKLIAPNSTGTGRVLRQALASGVNGVSYVSSFYAKYVSGEFAWIRALGTDAGVVWFDIQNGVRGTVTGANTTGTITSVGNGWYRCVITSTASSVNIYSYLNPVDADGSTTTTGDGSKGVLIWGADLRPTNIGSQIPAYQRVVDANTYDSTGFPRRLVFNGTSSVMSTASNFPITGNPTFTCFWAQNRKSASTTGGFGWGVTSGPLIAAGYIYVPGSGGLFAYAGGNNLVFATDNINEPVVYSYAKTPGAINTTSSARRNGANNNGVGSSSSTPNISLAPLYVGVWADVGGSYFNGDIYSLIVVGSAVSAGSITATETWVNGKTGGVY